MQKLRGANPLGGPTSKLDTSQALRSGSNQLHHPILNSFSALWSNNFSFNYTVTTEDTRLLIIGYALYYTRSVLALMPSNRAINVEE